jgi:hypothetical protein
MFNLVIGREEETEENLCKMTKECECTLRVTRKIKVLIKEKT